MQPVGKRGIFGKDELLCGFVKRVEGGAGSHIRNEVVFGLSRKGVQFLLALGRIDQNCPASHSVHVDILAAHIDEDQAFIQIGLVRILANLVQAEAALGRAGGISRLHKHGHIVSKHLVLVTAILSGELLHRRIVVY